MGSLHYGFDAGHRIDIDDRTLAHLQIVIITKLRRGETFAFTWHTPHEGGSGRTALWFAPSVPLRFEYFGGQMATINRDWLDLLAATTASVHGLHVVEEPAIAARAPADY